MKIASLQATAWSWVIVLWTFACEHQAITAWMVGTVVAYFLKPQSPEHYARIAEKHPTWFFARWAAFRQLLPTQFSDPAKWTSILLEKIFKGPPKPPTGRSVVPSSDPPPPSFPPRAARMMLAACALSLLVATPGCSLLTKRNAKTVLDAAALACVLQSELTDEGAVADACALARELIPTIRSLIASKKAGVCRAAPMVDVGANDASSP